MTIVLKKLIAIMQSFYFLSLSFCILNFCAVFWFYNTLNPLYIYRKNKDYLLSKKLITSAVSLAIMSSSFVEITSTLIFEFGFVISTIRSLFLWL